MVKNTPREYAYCREALYRMNVGVSLDQELAYNATLEALSIKDTTARSYFLAAFFHSHLVAGPTADSVIGMLNASFSLDDYRPELRPLLTDSQSLPSITLMGSGKKGLKTVNISTLAAITASSSKRIIVTKPCTTAVSSLTGSADFLSVLGLSSHKDKEKMRDIALETGLGIFFVNTNLPRFTQSYDDVFYAPHAMSYALAGLVSPYATDALLYGLALPFDALSLEVFRHFKVKNPMVVSSTIDNIHFVDEALLPGKTTIGLMQNGKPIHREYEFEKILADSVVSVESFSPVHTNSKEDNVAKGLRSIRSGRISQLGKTIALNAGVIMHAGGVSSTIEQAYAEACELIETGAAWQQLSDFVHAAGGSMELPDKIVRQK